MALFRLFKPKSKEDTKDAPVSTEIEQGNFDKEANTEKKEENKRVVTITWGTGLPIDVIFNYIHKDFEEEAVYLRRFIRNRMSSSRPERLSLG